MNVFRTRPVRIHERLILIAIESVECVPHKSINGCRFFARVEPTALVICGPEAARALDMHGNPVDVEELRRHVPALDADLDTYGQSFDLAR